VKQLIQHGIQLMAAVAKHANDEQKNPILAAPRLVPVFSARRKPLKSDMQSPDPHQFGVWRP
jgi:hypothetical protein